MKDSLKKSLKQSLLDTDFQKINSLITKVEELQEDLSLGFQIHAGKAAKSIEKIVDSNVLDGFLETLTDKLKDGFHLNEHEELHKEVYGELEEEEGEEKKEDKLLAGFGDAFTEVFKNMEEQVAQALPGGEENKEILLQLTKEEKDQLSNPHKMISDLTEEKKILEQIENKLAHAHEIYNEDPDLLDESYKETIDELIEEIEALRGVDQCLDVFSNILENLKEI